MTRLRLLAIVLALGIAARAEAQDSCGVLRPAEVSGVRYDIVNVATMADTLAPALPLFRRGSTPDERSLCDAPAWLDPWLERGSPLTLYDVEIDVEPVSLASEYNSAYPRDRLNGALWSGRGVSAALGLGARARWRWISGSVRPLLLYQANDEFRTVATNVPGHSTFVYPWYEGRIDWPQRFGEESFGGLELGPSHVRADVGAFALGFSNENLWWGPAQRYPIVMSSNAAGFPHAFIGTSGAVPWYGGDWQVEAFWGRLAESDYFDVDAANDYRLFSGFTLGYSPSFVPGLSIGAARTLSTTMYPDRYSLWDQVAEPFRDVSANEPGAFGDDQILAAYMRWHLPVAGFQAWAEWARGDYWAGARDLLVEIDHTQSYTLGVSKLIELRGGAVRVLGELTDTEKGVTQFSSRGTPVTFTNGSVRQGHTHRGQLLGSPLGPASNAQIVAVDWLAPFGVVGAEVERARYDASAYYPRFSSAFGFHGHDFEITGALRFARSTPNWDLSARLGYSHRENRNFVTLPDLLLTGFDFRFPVDRNWGLGLELRWKPDLPRPRD